MTTLKKAMKSAEMRWFGEERLLQMGERLSQFQGIASVKPAKAFKATLLDYQQGGLNWPQFLREYNLAGILADNMGLEKTIQALAHLAVEKAA